MMPPAIRILRKPLGALQDLLECLVIEFGFNRKASRFRLITDFPCDDDNADRAFLELDFLGVRDFNRERGMVAAMQRYGSHYTARAEQTAIVIQSVEHASIDGGGNLSLWFGPAFGGVTLTYSDIAGRLRSARVEKRLDGFVYRDADSGRRLDFYRPFE